MNSMANKLQGISLKLTIFLLSFHYMNASAVTNDKSTMRAHPYDEPELVIEAKIVAMQGGCNSVRCPPIQYKLAATNIVENKISPNSPESDVSVLRVCGPSGLKLGGHYRFVLKSSSGVFKGSLDRPMAEGGEYLECEFVFMAEGVRAAPISADELVLSSSDRHIHGPRLAT